jgi:membrane associated rhomboid family serine protease
MSDIYNMRRQRQGAIPDVIFILLILNGLAYAAQWFSPNFMWQHFALWPLDRVEPSFMPWQLVSYGFLHDMSGLSHLLFNMFGLWMFGRDIERSMGTSRFLTYYLTCVIGAGIVQLVVAKTTGSIYPTIGASGGVFGILLAYGMAFPNRTVMLLIPPIPMKAKYFVLIYGVITLYFAFSGRASGVAHFAHLGGMLFGFGLIMYWRHGPRRL